MAELPRSPRANSPPLPPIPQLSPTSSTSPSASPSPLLSPTWSWKSTSPALQTRKGAYVGRRGSFVLDEEPTSPKHKPAIAIPALSVPDEQYSSSPLSPRKGTTLPKCLSSEKIDPSPRLRRGSASDIVQKQMLKVFKKEDNSESSEDHHTTTSTTSTSPPSPSAMSGVPTSPTSHTTKLRPLIRIDSFGPEKFPPTEEPAHVKLLREDVKQGVADLIKSRKLHALESITSFQMKDTKHGKYVKSFIRLAKNHQELQFGDAETVSGDEYSDIYFPLKLQVTNISLVEDRTPKDLSLSSETVPSGYHIWFFDKVHRGEYDLITNNEIDYMNWFEGLRALVGITVESVDAPTARMLSDLEVDMRLYHMEVNEANQHAAPPSPQPLSESSGNQKQPKEEEEGWELWRRCYADLPDGEDCFNFATYQHPLFISL